MISTTLGGAARAGATAVNPTAKTTNRCHACHVISGPFARVVNPSRSWLDDPTVRLSSAIRPPRTRAPPALDASTGSRRPRTTGDWHARDPGSAVADETRRTIWHVVCVEIRPWARP